MFSRLLHLAVCRQPAPLMIVELYTFEAALKLAHAPDLLLTTPILLMLLLYGVLLPRQLHRCGHCPYDLLPDPQLVAERRQPMLQLSHWAMGRPGRLLAAFVIPWFAALGLGLALGVLDEARGSLLAGVGLLPGSLLTEANRVHARLRSWCLWCGGGGGGGGGHQAPDPVPPADRRTLPV